MRTIPDVSALAEFYLGLRIGLTQYGIEALLVQEHGPLGFANPAFCSRAGTFHCITDDQAGTPHTIAYAVNEFDGVVLATPGQYAHSDIEFAPGFNTSTGLGSPTWALIGSFRPRGEDLSGRRNLVTGTTAVLTAPSDTPEAPACRG